MRFLRNLLVLMVVGGFAISVLANSTPYHENIPIHETSSNRVPQVKVVSRKLAIYPHQAAPQKRAIHSRQAASPKPVIHQNTPHQAVSHREIASPAKIHVQKKKVVSRTKAKPQKEKVVKKNKPTHVVIPLSKYISNVIVKAPVRVVIHDGAKYPRVVFSGDQRYVHNVLRVRVAGDQVLLKTQYPTLQATSCRFNQLQVDIYVKHLRNLVVNHAAILTVRTVKASHFSLNMLDVGRIYFIGGAVIPNLTVNGCASFSPTGSLYVNQIFQRGLGNITIHHARGREVVINTKGPGSINMDGSFSLAALIKRGNGNVMLHGTGKGCQTIVDSWGCGSVTLHTNVSRKLALTVRGAGHYYLSGYARRFNVVAYDTTDVEASRLKAYRAFAKSYGTALIDLRVLHQIFAKSEDCSRIEYYGFPPLRFVHARTGSSILALSQP